MKQIIEFDSVKMVNAFLAEQDKLKAENKPYEEGMWIDDQHGRWTGMFERKAPKNKIKPMGVDYVGRRIAKSTLPEMVAVLETLIGDFELSDYDKDLMTHIDDMMKYMKNPTSTILKAEITSKEAFVMHKAQSILSSLSIATVDCRVLSGEFVIEFGEW